MTNWMYITLALIGFAGAIALLSWVASRVIDDIFEIKEITNFSKDFKDAIKHSQPTWEEIKEIALTRRLTQANIQTTIKKYYREIMTGRDDDLNPHKDLIKSYIDQYNKDEPFEGLPGEVKIHLERIRDQIKGNEHYLEPLTSKIKDLLTLNKKDQRNQRYFTSGGFFVGLAGFAFALFTSFAQPKIEVATQDQSTTSIEIPSQKTEPTIKQKIN